MNKLNIIDWAAFVLVIVGGLNWLLVGLFSWDLVAAIFGSMSVITKIIYDLVGLAALYMLVMMSKYARK